MTLEQALDILFRQGFAVFIACFFLFRLDKTLRLLVEVEHHERELMATIKELLERRL